MPGLSSRLRHDDRGAVTVLVAAVLGIGLLLGMGAVVIDAGQLRAERAQLRTGADAAALAIANQCVKGSCGATGYATATHYAVANAKDGAAVVNLVCGVGSGLAACPATDPEPKACLGTRPSSGFVEVRTSTQLPDGSTVLPPVFGRVLLGQDYDGRGVLACARVGWGGPRTSLGFAMTISLCEWQAATANGTVFGPAPPAVTSALYERVLALHGTGNACAAGASGWDLPGGFGWLDDATGQCKTQVDVTGTYHDNSGASASQACKSALSLARRDRKVVLVPVFDGVSGQGTNGTYHLKGFASFVITGYSLPGFTAVSALSNRVLCTGSTTCVYGYFTRQLLGTAVLGGADLGSTAVQLIG